MPHPHSEQHHHHHDRHGPGRGWGHRSHSRGRPEFEAGFGGPRHHHHHGSEAHSHGPGRGRFPPRDPPTRFGPPPFGPPPPGPPPFGPPGPPRFGEDHPFRHHGPHGLHWLGVGVLATTLVRKGQGHSLLWFSLGALVAGLFMKKHFGLGGMRGGHGGPRGFFGGRGRWSRSGRDEGGVRWNVDVALDEEDSSDSSTGPDPWAREGCPYCSGSAQREEASGPRRECDCGNAEPVPAEDVLFDAAAESGEKPTAADAEKEDEIIPQATQSPINPSLERRIDVLTSSIEDLRFQVTQLTRNRRSRSSSTASSGLDVGVVYNEGVQPRAE